MTGSCSLPLLESALAGDLPPEREELLHRHLEDCEACAVALEQMAGGEAWCREAAALLSGDDLDNAVPAREEWSTADFTVEHLEPSDELGVLGRLSGYDVLEIIGRGGMGVVLKRYDRELKRCVAIKVLSPHLAQSSLARKRFAREAQAAAAVVHPNVLAIHQVQPSGRLPFLVMPLVAGESLAQRLVAQGRLELNEVLRIGMQAAAGLAAAHEQGLVHRDVKPANILLEKGVERAVLTDFGLARAADDVSLTRWGIIAGTPQYMSPEQARGEPLDARSDLFSLGCVLYEMASGVSPFRADSTMATLRRLIDDPPPAISSLNPELPSWFVGIVDRLLEKDPARRFGSAKEVSELLEGCLAHLQQPACVPLPAGLAAPAAAPVSRLRKTLFKGAIAMVSALGIGFLGMFLAQATAPPDIAGRWSGENWGKVVLTEIAPGEYAGRYTETVGKGPGKIELKWSRIERRFNGTWSEGEDRFGDLSIRLAGEEIRGALTTDRKSKINPATPRLADLVWTRGESQAGAEAPPASVPPTVTVSRPTAGMVDDYLDFTGSVEAGNPMRLVFYPDERLLAQLRRATIKEAGGKTPKPDWAAKFTALFGLPDEKDFPHRARIQAADDRVDPVTGAARWVAEIPKGDSVAVPGMFARVRLVTDAPHEALLIPERALWSDQGRERVWVSDERNVLQAPPRDPGTTPRRAAGRQAGVTADDWVVVSDVGGLRPGMIVKPDFGKGAADLSAEPRVAAARVAAAEHFVDLLRRGEFQKAAECFEDTMKKQVPPAELQKVWERLDRAGGKFQRYGPSGTGVYASAVFVPALWEHNKIKFKVVFDYEGRISGLWTVRPMGGATPPGNAATASASPFEARLPNGVTVELLGVAESPSKGRPWWRPDGSPLAGRPYDSLDDAMVASQFEIVRELAFRLDNLPAEPVGTIWRCGATMSAPRFGPGRPIRPSIPVEKLRAVSAAIRDAIETEVEIGTQLESSG